MTMADRKTSHVVMLGNSRGHKAGDVVPVTSEQAEALIRDRLARAPQAGEVKAAEGK